MGRSNVWGDERIRCGEVLHLHGSLEHDWLIEAIEQERLARGGPLLGGIRVFVRELRAATAGHEPELADADEDEASSHRQENGPH